MTQWMLLFFAVPSLALAADSAALTDFCQAKEICAPLGTDNACKYLVQTSVPAEHVINKALLESAVEQWLSDPAATEAIGKALKRGDWLLAQALKSSLALINISPHESDTILAAWANGSGTERVRKIISTVMAHPSSKEILVEYVLETPTGLARFLRGLEWCWDHPQDPTSVAVGLRASRRAAKALWQAAIDGDITARCQIAESNSRWGLSNCALGVLLRSQGNQGTNQSLDESVWRAFFGAVAKDPLYTKELFTRLKAASPVYDRLQRDMASGLLAKGLPLLAAYTEASVIPESRYEYVCRQLYGDGFQPGRNPGQDSASDRALAQWSELILRDDKWFNYLVWHLTRPASVVGMTTLQALRVSLTQEATLAQQAAEALDAEPLAARKPAVSAGADTPQFRQRRAAGELLNDDWKRYGEVLGTAINLDWNFAKTMLTAKSSAGTVFVSEALAVAVPSSADATRVWIESMLKTDPALFRAFSGWLVQSGKMNDDPAARQWLQQAAADAARGGISEEVGRFKIWFAAFVRTTEGRRAAQMRLAVELWGIPGTLRELLIDRWLNQTDDYMRWRAMASALPSRSGGVLAGDAIQVTRAVGFSQSYLEGCKEGDVDLDEAVEPVWKSMLIPEDSALAVECQKQFTSGPVISPIYAAGCLALQDVLIRLPSECQSALQSAGYQDSGAVFSVLLANHGLEARPYAAALLNDRAIWKKWKSSLLSAVIFGGHSMAVARVIESSPSLFESWSKELEEELRRNPEALRRALDSLARRRAGDLRYAETVRFWQKLLMQADAANQPFFEQLYVDPTGGYGGLIIERAKNFGITL